MFVATWNVCLRSLFWCLKFWLQSWIDQEARLWRKFQPLEGRQEELECGDWWRRYCQGPCRALQGERRYWKDHYQGLSLMESSQPGCTLCRESAWDWKWRLGQAVLGLVDNSCLSRWFVSSDFYHDFCDEVQQPLPIHEWFFSGKLSDLKETSVVCPWTPQRQQFVCSVLLIHFHSP